MGQQRFPTSIVEIVKSTQNFDTQKKLVVPERNFETNPIQSITADKFNGFFFGLDL